jgi:hypothetical protein
VQLSLNFKQSKFLTKENMKGIPCFNIKRFRLYVILLFTIFINSCNDSTNKINSDSKIEAATSKPQGRWALFKDSTSLAKPLGSYLKLTSDTIILYKSDRNSISNTFMETSIEFDILKDIDVKTLKNELTTARIEINESITTIENKNTRHVLFNNYALLEITLLDSIKNVIPNSQMTSYDSQGINNLSHKTGKVLFSFRTDITNNECASILASDPKYFKLSLSNKATGISKVFSDYIRKTK